jgi:protocatechuate 4,5-dioxygenase, alpha chain
MIEMAHGRHQYPCIDPWASALNTSWTGADAPSRAGLDPEQAYPTSAASKETSVPKFDPRQPVPGTTIFDGEQARKGYALNKMCYSFNDAANRVAFMADEEAYCAAYGLNAKQREAIRSRNVLQLIEARGNAYYLAKFVGIFGLDMQDIGAQQTGMTKDEFKAKLLAARG